MHRAMVGEEEPDAGGGGMRCVRGCVGAGRAVGQRRAVAEIEAAGRSERACIITGGAAGQSATNACMNPVRPIATGGTVAESAGITRDDAVAGVIGRDTVAEVAATVGIKTIVAIAAGHAIRHGATGANQKSQALSGTAHSGTVRNITWAEKEVTG